MGAVQPFRFMVEVDTQYFGSRCPLSISN